MDDTHQWHGRLHPPVSWAIWVDVWNDETVAGPPGLTSTEHTTRTHNRNWIRSGTRNQWSSRSSGVVCSDVRRLKQTVSRLLTLMNLHFEVCQTTSRINSWTFFSSTLLHHGDFFTWLFLHHLRSRLYFVCFTLVAGYVRFHINNVETSYFTQLKMCYLMSSGNTFSVV